MRSIDSTVNSVDIVGWVYVNYRINLPWQSVQAREHCQDMVSFLIMEKLPRKHA